MQVINRALSILELLESSQAGIGVSDLARELGLNVSTTHNILKALRLRGYVAQTPTSQYVLGPRLITLAARAVKNSSLVRAASEPLEELHRWSEETVFMGVLQNTSIINLILHEGLQPLVVRTSLITGARLHSRAMGKVLLAGLSDEKVETLMAETGMPPATDKTITDVDMLKKQLAEIRRQGYAINLAEDAPGVHGIAAPVYDHMGRVTAGVCVGYPGHHWQGADVDKLIEQVVACGQRISRALGYQGAERGA